MSQRKTKPRPNRRTVQIHRDDHVALKKIAGDCAPLPVHLSITIRAARLALESLPAAEQLGFIRQAATAQEQPTAPA